MDRQGTDQSVPCDCEDDHEETQVLSGTSSESVGSHQTWSSHSSPFSKILLEALVSGGQYSDSAFIYITK